jgi:spore coat protein A
MVPVGWTSVHLHGGHSRPDSDGWPDNTTARGGGQLDEFDNTYDNADLGLGKVGAHLWYHDHAMNGTRHHVFAGLAGGYLLRDPREADELGLPVCAADGEMHLLLQDRNLDVVEGELQLLHKTTPDTAEFFGPLTLVEGRLWPRVPVRPAVYRLRLLNGSNARTYRLHLVGETADEEHVSDEHHRLLVIGTDGGLLWRAWQPATDEPLVLAPAERLDVLIDLTKLPDGARLHLVNSAPAPFGGDPIPGLPALETLLKEGDRRGLNPYPWVVRFDIDADATNHGQPRSLWEKITAIELNSRFRRLVHRVAEPLPLGEPAQFPLADHEHRMVLLAETDPPGHLYLHEVVADPFGEIELQLPDEALPTRYRVEGWTADDHAPSSSRVSFYDRVVLRPGLGRWQVWRIVNATADTHPIHIHQSQFQPLDDAAAALQVTAGKDGPNLYDPTYRRTRQPLVPVTSAESCGDSVAGRRFDPSETHGWKDVIRVDPGNVVKVAVRFDIPGRYVYHCHVLEHEDTEMMRPFIVTVTNMNDEMTAHHHR